MALTLSLCSLCICTSVHQVSLTGLYLTVSAGYSDFGAIGSCSDSNVQAYTEVGCGWKYECAGLHRGGTSRCSRSTGTLSK